MAKRDGEEAAEDREDGHGDDGDEDLSLIHISEPTRPY